MSNTSERGREIHAQEEQAREKGEFLEALKLADEAMIAYQEDGDMAGFAEIHAAKFLILRHLHEKTEDKRYLVLAKHMAMVAAELAEMSGQTEATAIPLFNLAKAQEDVGEISEAVETYRRAVGVMRSSPPETHDRPAVLADMENQMAVCEYKNGDEAALQRAEEAIGRIASAEEKKYEKDVWVSGGYMRIADALKEENPQLAGEYLEKAREVIEANEELVLRKKQWEKLAKKIGVLLLTVGYGLYRYGGGEVTGLIV